MAKIYYDGDADLRLIQQRKGNLADQLVSSKASWEERVDRLFLSVLNRPPRPAFATPCARRPGR